MNILIDKLSSMKLFGMASALNEYSDNQSFREMEFSEQFGMILEHEKIYRQNKQLKRLITAAKFRYPDASIENINFRNRGLTRQLLINFSNIQWIKDKRNIIITGATGTGKTYISCAIGNSACRSGIKTLYIRQPRLFQELKIAKADGSYIKKLDKISKIELLIIDDWGLSAMDDAQRRDILEIAEDRHDIRSTIIATQFPIDKWHSLIGDPTIADAICDRLIYNAYKLKLTGESMRKIKMKELGMGKD